MTSYFTDCKVCSHDNELATTENCLPETTNIHGFNYSSLSKRQQKSSLRVARSAVSVRARALGVTRVNASEAMPGREIYNTFQ